MENMETHTQEKERNRILQIFYTLYHIQFKTISDREKIRYSSCSNYLSFRFSKNRAKDAFRA